MASHFAYSSNSPRASSSRGPSRTDSISINIPRARRRHHGSCASAPFACKASRHLRPRARWSNRDHAVVADFPDVAGLEHNQGRTARKQVSPVSSLTLLTISPVAHTQLYESIHSHPFAKVYPEVGLQEYSVLLLTHHFPFLPVPSGRHDQTAIRQCDTPIRCRQLAYRLSCESRLRRCLLMLTHDAEFSESPGSQWEDVLWLPIRLWPPSLEDPLRS